MGHASLTGVLAQPTALGTCGIVVKRCRRSNRFSLPRVPASPLSNPEFYKTVQIGRRHYDHASSAQTFMSSDSRKVWPQRSQASLPGAESNMLVTEGSTKERLLESPMPVIHSSQQIRSLRCHNARDYSSANIH